MLELANHKKTAAVIAVLLCIPLVFVVLFAVQLVTGGISFDHVTEASLELRDGSRLTFKEGPALSLYVGMLERATPIDDPVRDVEKETPLKLTVGEEVYELYPSTSLSGCMAFDKAGKCYLLDPEDAAALVVRPELEYLYAEYHLPSLTVRSGENVHPILPLEYVWSYKKADGVYYNDLSAPTSQEILSFNLFADFENGMEFSVEPSHYSFVVRKVEDGNDGAEIPVTSLGGLHFTGDTLVSVEITATWSQASNSAQYGEAHYRFLALYDVPAAVKLLGSENNAVTLTAGGYLSLIAEYTNPAEDLSITFEGQTDNLKFYHHPESGNSYAFLPVSPETPAGTYPLTVRSGEKEYIYSVTVEERKNEAIISYAPNADDYQAYYAPAVLEALHEQLAQLRKASDGTPRLRTDLLFIEVVRGELAYDYGTTVIIGNAEAAEDPGLSYLKGKLYHGTEGHTVEATQQGICVFAGELGAAGNTVVIDHGCGIFSYYCLLDSVSVKAGDQISRAEELGSLGASADNGNFFFALSLGDTFITD